MTKKSNVVVILSISSDIGNYLAHQYLSRGWHVIGTYRQAKHLQGLSKTKTCDLFNVDVTKPSEIQRFISKLKQKRIKINRLVCAVGNLLPAQKFFDCDFDVWQEGVMTNALGPLRVIHGLYPLMVKDARIVLFAGGAANNAPQNISAYAISKIMLTKMTEFIDAEYPNLHVSIVGPGWTVTKIHADIIKGKGVDALKLKQTKQDLNVKPSTSLADIDACIEWVCALPKTITSGRNFSVVYDPWRPTKANKLIDALKKDANMYKLRRHKNDTHL